ncbi:unnamed protein product, partial [Rotaria socialis]
INGYWIYRLNRLLSSCQSKNGENLFSPSTALSSTMKKLFDSKQYKEALNLFDQTFEISTDSTIDMAIKACTISKDYKHVECKDIDNAMHLFSSITNKSNYMYTVMFKGLITNNMAEKVLDLFGKMKIEPNQFTLSTSFNACAVLNNNRVMKTGKKLLDEMPENHRNDNITHQLQQLTCYFGNEMFEKALDLFEQIHLSLTNVIYTIVFNTCAKLCNNRAMKIEKKLLAEVPESYRNDNITSTSAIDMLMKFGDAESVEQIFRSVKAKGADIYGASMNGYNLNGESWKCFKVFEEMNEKNIIPDEIAWNVLLGACSKSGMLHHCQYIMNQIPLNIQNNIRI